MRNFSTPLVAFVLILASSAVTSCVVFPFGGGEYHAIFSSSAGGWINGAILVWCVYVGSACLAAIGLLLAGLRSPALGTVIAASAVVALRWLGIVTYYRQSDDFHRVALTLLALTPLAVPAILVPALLSTGHLQFQARRSAATTDPPRSRRRLVVGLVLLAFPVALLARQMLQPRFDRLGRLQWRPAPWIAIARDSTIPALDSTRGVIFSRDGANDLVNQCIRPTPGWIVGTWVPAAAQIRQLEEDLASYFAESDTRPVHDNGYVMPPLASYYRQYGGITTLFGTKSIYVNGIAGETYWTTEFKGDGTPVWHVSAVSICGGGWGAFGIEYDPIGRRVRGFAYNQ